MTYNMFGGTLKFTQPASSINDMLQHMLHMLGGQFQHIASMCKSVNCTIFLEWTNASWLQYVVYSDHVRFDTIIVEYKLFCFMDHRVV